jgi:hypothetical protein
MFINIDTTNLKSESSLGNAPITFDRLLSSLFSLNFDSKDSKNSQTREKLKRKTDVPPQLSIEVTP